MAQGWAEFIWKQHRLVSFRRFDPEDVELLDVIVKEGRHGIPIPIPGFDTGPVLVRIGRIFDLGAPPPTSATRSEYHDAASDLDDSDSDSDTDSDEAEGVVDVATLQKELGLLRSPFAGGSQLRYLYQAHLGDWSMLLSASSSFGATLCGLARASIAGGHALSCSIQNIQAEAVDVDQLAKLLCAHPPGWVPNLEAIQQRRRLSARSSSSKKALELWVVTKIVYARKVVLGKTGHNSAGVTVPLPEAGLGLVAAVAGVQEGVGVEGGTTKVDFVEVVAGTGPRPGLPIGYEAIRVTYDKDGSVRLRMEMGESSRPVHRTAEEDEGVDLDKDAEYHMGELMDASQESHQLIPWQTYVE